MAKRRYWLAICALAAGALLCTTGGDRLLTAEEPPRPERIKGGLPLANGVLRDAVERIESGKPAGADIDVVAGKIRVEVIHALDPDRAAELVEARGGVIEGQIEGLVQALVPVGQLVALEAEASVRYLRPPLDANVPIDPPKARVAGVSAPAGAPIVGKEVLKTNADDWHAAGYTGAGAKIGVIDFFDGDLWDAAQAAGELPEPAGTFCRIASFSCDIWSLGGDHGQGVAEIIHEMAPDAQLYLASVLTTTDLQAAVDYFDSQDVDIISRSLTSQYDGPGDGTGPIASVIDNAVADGMAWFNSAGNSAGGGEVKGQYWRSHWKDLDNDGWMEFSPGNEFLAFGCGLVNGLRWSDFGTTNPTDYDVFVFDLPDASTQFYSSEDYQGIGGSDPIEMLDFECLEGQLDYMAIKGMRPTMGRQGMCWNS